MMNEKFPVLNTVRARKALTAAARLSINTFGLNVLVEVHETAMVITATDRYSIGRKTLLYPFLFKDMKITPSVQEYDPATILRWMPVLPAKELTVYQDETGLMLGDVKIPSAKARDYERSAEEKLASYISLLDKKPDPEVKGARTVSYSVLKNLMDWTDGAVIDLDFVPVGKRGFAMRASSTESVVLSMEMTKPRS